MTKLPKRSRAIGISASIMFMLAILPINQSVAQDFEQATPYNQPYKQSGGGPTHHPHPHPTHRPPGHHPHPPIPYPVSTFCVEHPFDVNCRYCNENPNDDRCTLCVQSPGDPACIGVCNPHEGDFTRCCDSNPMDPNCEIY